MQRKSDLNVNQWKLMLPEVPRRWPGDSAELLPRACEGEALRSDCGRNIRREETFQ